MAKTSWRESKWGDEISLEYGKALRGHDVSIGPVRVYGTNGPIGWTQEALSNGPGVILGRKGANRGVEYSEGPFHVIDTAYYVVPKTDLDMRWLYYAIKFHKLGEIDDGSPIPSTTRSAVYVRDVAIPPIAEQRRIAHILGTLDDKIDLNRRMNETLEEMARALFKSWFVDFDPVRAKAEGRDPGLPKHLADLFPDRLVDSELGEIPNGWDPRRLGDLFSLEKGLSYKGAYLKDEGVPMWNLGCFGGDGNFADGAVKHYTGEFAARHTVAAGDLLIANTDITQNRVVIGSPALVPPSVAGQRSIFTHHVYAARFYDGHESWRQYAFFALLQHEFRSRARGFAIGTTVLALPKEAIADHRVALPPLELLKPFRSLVDGIRARQGLATAQTSALVATRDALLVRLMSARPTKGE